MDVAMVFLGGERRLLYVLLPHERRGQTRTSLYSSSISLMVMAE